MDFDTIKRNVLAEGRVGRVPRPADLAAQSACLDLLHSSFAVIDFGQASRCMPLYAEGASSLIDGKLTP